MSEKRRFIFLSNEFYAAYPSTKYPEIEQKHNRPYIQISYVCIICDIDTFRIRDILYI